MPLIMCPNCQAGMQQINRDAVQIDICPQCRGVWLDRGELEKLLGTVREAEQEWQGERQYFQNKYQDREREYFQKHHHKHKKKSKLHNIMELFD